MLDESDALLGYLVEGVVEGVGYGVGRNIQGLITTRSQCFLSKHPPICFTSPSYSPVCFWEVSTMPPNLFAEAVPFLRFGSEPTHRHHLPLNQWP